MYVSFLYIFFILLQFYNTDSTPLSFLSHTNFTATKVCISMNRFPSVTEEDNYFKNFKSNILESLHLE